MLVSVWIVLGVSLYLQAHERYTQGIVQEDRSITNRLTLWQAAPAMMKDAPQGWGLGNSGKAYREWYQPLDQHEVYRTLVNSHLTWLVEFGWVGRFLYVFGWLSVFLICFPGGNTRWFSIPFGVWLSFFTGAVFSSVAESVWLWVLPGLALLGVMLKRLKQRQLSMRGGFVLPVAGTALLVLAAFFLFPSGGIRKTSHAIIVGNGEPEVWMVADRNVLGKYYGRVLRGADPQWMTYHLGIVDELQKLPSGLDSPVILTGRFTEAPSEKSFEKIAMASSILLVNPALFPAELGEMQAFQNKITVWTGEYTQSPASHAWLTEFDSQRLSGMGDFISNWPVHLLKNRQE